MNFYKRYPGDYQRDTAHLTLVEHGVYAMLLDTYYATERPLPAEYPALMRICRAMDKDEQLAVKKIADQFFPIGEDNLRHNRRADLEITEQLPRIQTARDNGKKGGRPRKANPNETQEKPSGFSAGYPADNPDETQSEPNSKAHQTPEYLLRPDGYNNKGSSSNERERAHETQTLLPSDFEPDQLANKLAKEHGLSLADELPRFMAHHEARGEYRANWQAQFRKWLLDAAQFKADAAKRAAAPQRIPQRSTGKPTQDDVRARNHAELERIRKERQQ